MTEGSEERWPKRSILLLEQRWNSLGRAVGSAYDCSIMPFSSLSDPVDVARAQGALDTVWSEIRFGIPDATRSRRERALPISWLVWPMSRWMRQIWFVAPWSDIGEKAD